MTILESIILGITQGLTEFLPVSSSGHLVIVEQLLGITSTALTFEIIVHLATLLAVIWYFRKDLLKIQLRELWLLGIGTIPAVLFGVFFKDWIEAAFNSLLQVSFELSITAALLFFAQHKLRQMSKGEIKGRTDITTKDAAIIGSWQAVAIMPAISRSGSTVAGALFLNIDREVAFRYSFLLSIPAILGAAVFQLMNVDFSQPFIASDLIPYAFGFVFALVFGLLSLRWFHLVIKRLKLHYFGFYCLGLSLLLLALQATGVLK